MGKIWGSMVHQIFPIAPFFPNLYARGAQASVRQEVRMRVGVVVNMWIAVNVGIVMNVRW